MPLWAASLIVGGVLVLVALILGLLAMRSFKKAGMPTPDEAIVEAKATVDEIKKEAHIA